MTDKEKIPFDWDIYQSGEHEVVVSESGWEIVSIHMKYAFENNLKISPYDEYYYEANMCDYEYSICIMFNKRGDYIEKFRNDEKGKIYLIKKPPKMKTLYVNLYWAHGCRAELGLLYTAKSDCDIEEKDRLPRGISSYVKLKTIKIEVP